MNKKIDLKMFQAIKTLLNGGATYKECAEYMKVGVTTVGRIAVASDYTDYKNQLAAMHLELKRKQEEEKKKKEQQKQVAAQVQMKASALLMPNEKTEPQVVEHRQTVTVQTTHFTMQKLDNIIELLTGMSAKLACIIDDLYGTKKEENR